MGYHGLNRYYYEGPVEEFGRVITMTWSGSTYAPTEQKARCNLTYQFKTQNNKLPTTKITLPGKIEQVG